MAGEPDYAVPALDKALDVLELLAESPRPLSQAEIAAATGRSVNQLFRVLTTLERRGYLIRDRQSALYLLSTRLFDLAHRHEPVRSLIAAAHPPMRVLADETRSSCNLSVLDADRMRIVAQVVSPSDFGFQVRIGALFPVETTASGLVQLAFSRAQDARPRAPTTAEGGASVATVSKPTARELSLDAIAEQGYLERPDSLQPGVTDIVFPVLDDAGGAVAVLTVPYVATSFSDRSPGFVRERAGVAVRAIAQSLYGR